MEDMEKIVDESVMSETQDSNFSESVASPTPSASSSFKSTATVGQRKRRVTNAEPDKSAKETAREKKNEAVLEALNTLAKLKSQSTTTKDQFSAFGEQASIQMRELPADQGKIVLRKMNQYLLQCLEEADQMVSELN